MFFLFVLDAVEIGSDFNALAILVKILPRATCLHAVEVIVFGD